MWASVIAVLALIIWSRLPKVWNQVSADRIRFHRACWQVVKWRAFVQEFFLRLNARLLITHCIFCAACFYGEIDSISSNISWMTTQRLVFCLFWHFLDFHDLFTQSQKNSQCLVCCTTSGPLTNQIKSCFELHERLNRGLTGFLEGAELALVTCQQIID